MSSQIIDRLGRVLIKALCSAMPQWYRKETKLLMTLLVRDEIDIVKANIDFHLDHGVDFIIATDNGSNDGTEKVLEEYQQKGVLHLIREEEQNFCQSQWVNRMGLIALEKYKADIVFHCDADEFWWPESGSLKNELSMRFNIDGMYVKVVNMIPRYPVGNNAFFDNDFHAVIRPFPSENLGVDSILKSLYLFPSPGKVIYKTRKGHLEVGQGNHHFAKKEKFIRSGHSHDVLIMHYPLRSYDQFRRKVVNGGSAYEKHPTKAGGWQWRRWYESYKRSNLEKDFSILTLDDESIRRYSDLGVLGDWSLRHTKICSYL